jgi:hypothetical protein
MEAILAHFQAIMEDFHRFHAGFTAFFGGKSGANKRATVVASLPGRDMHMAQSNQSTSAIS